MLNTPLGEFYIDRWFQVILQPDQKGNVEIIGNFKDVKLAKMVAAGKRATVEPIFVLTKDGKTGCLISTTPIKREGDDYLVRKSILNKLTRAEAKYIGLGDGKKKENNYKAFQKRFF